MATLLKLIEAEREHVQDLRTRLTIAKAFQDELDARTHGHVLTYANTTIQQMVSDHRHGVVARVAGWIHSAIRNGGFFDQLAANDLSELRARLDPEEDQPAIDCDAPDPFHVRFSHVAAGATLVPADLEPLRDQLRAAHLDVLANADAIRQHFEDAGASVPSPVSLEKVNAAVAAAEELLNDLAICAGGAKFEYSEYLANPTPRVTARDLVDLELMGTFDRLVSATGANDRLGASGMWWRQYREQFWQALEQAAEASPEEPINAPTMVRVARSRSRPLTTPQIERLVERYRLEYARYEATARSIEDKLRKMLEAVRVKALLASRAKDPKSLRKKLERKQSKYEFAALEADLGSVVTDLAGVRVIVYDDQDAEQVARLISDTWKGCSDETHDTRYRARHFTVMVTERESRSIDGARCEIQLTSLAAHAFNELEHDIGYKDQDVPAGKDVQLKLDILGQNTEALQLAIRELLAARKDELSAAKAVITTGVDLGTVLDGVCSGRATGDLDALFYLWQGKETQLTRPFVERHAPLLRKHGRVLAGPNVDDATAIATALFDASRSEAQDIARGYPDQDSALIRAILDPSVPEKE